MLLYPAHIHTPGLSFPFITLCIEDLSPGSGFREKHKVPQLRIMVYQMMSSPAFIQFWSQRPALSLGSGLVWEREQHL